MRRFSIGLFRRLFSRHSLSSARRPRKPVRFPAAIEHLEKRQLLTVTFHGGSVLPNVEAQAVYLGSDWQTSQTTPFDTFVSTIVSGGYMDMLTNAGYGVGRGTSSPGAIDNISLNKTKTGITDTSIQQDIQAMITAGTLQTPDANRLYIVYVEPGVVVTNGSDSSATTFLGYHGAFGGHTKSGAAADIHYAVIPYPDGLNISHSSQGFATAFDEQTAVTSHELAESVTDPNVNYKSLGWYDDQLNGEIGDLTRQTVSFQGYIVQDVVNQSDQVISPVTTTTTLTAPQNVTVTQVSSTSAQISWSASSGATGYRIYQVNGTTTTLLQTLGATSTSAQINGLPTGTSVSFKVEAFNATSVADSSTVSITLTTSTTLSAPILTDSVINSTTIQLNWNTVPGAQGFNLFYSDGFFTYYLTTLSASTTHVQVTGLVPGVTYHFIIQAFKGHSYANSNWVTVTTQTPQHHLLSHSGPGPNIGFFAQGNTKRRT